MSRPEVLNFSTPSFETTVNDAQQFVAAADSIPAHSAIIVGHAEETSMADQLTCVDALRTAGLTARPMLSARRVGSEDELSALLNELDQRNIDEVPVMGLPSFSNSRPTASPANFDQLTGKVHALQTAGLNVEIITQVSLDPDAVVDWISALRQRGITEPIRVGIPAPAPAEDLVRFCQERGGDADVEKLIHYGWLPDEVSQIADPAAFVEVLAQRLTADAGEVGVHVYPMGDVEAALEWLARL